MKFIESPIFTKLLKSYLTDEEYNAFQWNLVNHPEAGDIIPESGGLRKIRWAAKGRGKRGGVRVIYYYQNSFGTIWFLTIYAKNEASSIPVSILRKIKEELDI